MHMTTDKPARAPRTDAPDAPRGQEGYERACEMVHRCAGPHGFLASPLEHANYRRVWSRDGVILGLAALMRGEAGLVDTLRRTLETLAAYQGPHGEIPSNVDPDTGQVSYGGTTGRVDADLWYVIGCGQYWRACGDDAWVRRMWPSLERVQFLLGAWEFNNRGLLFVPPTGDWADEYVHSGYVLYDQLLYLQAQRELHAAGTRLGARSGGALAGRIAALRRLIRANYWFGHCDEVPEDAYHEVLARKGLEAAPHCLGRHWMPFFSPTGYGYRFDAFANVLASLVGVSDDDQRARVDRAIGEVTPRALPLLPAFHPVIEPVHEDWAHLQRTFSYEFKNRPHEYHNGGLWPLITGFYVADLAGRGLGERAARHLDAVHRGNALSMDGEAWSFPEFVHGRALTAGGMRWQGWSAAAAVIGHHALAGVRLLRGMDDDG